jgi:hypothetical protein
MFPDQAPVFYIAQLVIVAVAVLASLFVGWALAQPLALLSLLALQYLPSPQLLVPQQPFSMEDLMDEDDAGYDGRGKTGFTH